MNFGHVPKILRRDADPQTYENFGHSFVNSYNNKTVVNPNAEFYKQTYNPVF